MPFGRGRGWWGGWRGNPFPFCRWFPWLPRWWWTGIYGPITPWTPLWMPAWQSPYWAYYGGWW
ncbi:hypothetical protein [Candidatus Alkanophaga liquidiphilum]|nr:hypothetical protein [Candidatus Alkanophaga liquidiphilum]